MNQNLLVNKKCLITGGSRGLGLSMAKEFARQGARHIAITYSKNDLDAENAVRELKELDVELLTFKGLVFDRTHSLQVMKELNQQWGGLDILVNNAGSLQVLPVSLIEEADWDRAMNVNAKGAFLFSQAALRSMIKQKSGSILNIGTFSSERVIDVPIPYAAAKAALRGLTESMSKEVGRYNIRVNLIAPGALNGGVSQLLPQYRLQEYIKNCALSRVGTLDEIAKMAALIVSDRSAFVSGTKLVLDGGV